MGSIVVNGLGKAYRRYPNPWSRMASWIFPQRLATIEHKWVLKDISMHITSGQAVGLIGINGAGKSTLLKIITGAMAATEGTYAIEGRIAAMLELGLGFHPDFTGRQNVFMAGQLLGMSMHEIESLFSQIEAFAEIGTYIDEPVRTYSSGMQMRLAFSVATAQRPDILVIDEAFAVGDAYFQHKSFARIREFREAGTTLLLVSHDPSSIKSICDRAILLDGGRLLVDGLPSDVLDFYNALLAGREKQQVNRLIRDDGKTETRSGSGEAKVIDVRFVDASGQSVEMIETGTPARLEVDVMVHAEVPRLVLGYMIKDRLGQAMYGTNTDHKGRVLEKVAPGERLRFSFSFPMNLGPGTYSLSTSISSTDTHLVNNYEWRDLALLFTVFNVNSPYFVGCALLDPVVEIAR